MGPIINYTNMQLCCSWKYNLFCFWNNINQILLHNLKWKPCMLTVGYNTDKILYSWHVFTILKLVTKIHSVTHLVP